MRTITIILILTAFTYGTVSKYVLQTKRVNTSTITIICTNGGDPTGIKHGDVLTISCGWVGHLDSQYEGK